MLINLVKLGMMDEAKISESLNGYLNTYKNHMATSLRVLIISTLQRKVKIVTNKVVK